MLRDDADGIATLTLNRPEQLNALSPELFAELHEHLQAIAGATDAIGCVILRANGRAFSAGADLKARWRGASTSPSDVIAFMEALPQPIIAAVHGYCFTGAIELILGGDLVVAEASSQFADTHGKWGLIAGWGQTQRLPQRVGLMRAKQMMFTSRRFTAAEAQAMGLVTMVVPDGQLEARTRELAQEMLANSWHSLRGHKMLLNQGQNYTLADGLRFAREHNPGVAPDTAERTRAGGFGRRERRATES